MQTKAAGQPAAIAPAGAGPGRSHACSQGGRTPDGRAHNDRVPARSVSVLAHPGPGPVGLRTILNAAIVVPDHGRCRPWRFLVLEGDTKDAFGLVFEKAYLVRCGRHGDIPDREQQHREHKKLARTPVVIIVICRPNANGTIQHGDQRAAVAAATQNILLAATALDYGSMWRTGQAAVDSTVRETLSLGAPGKHQGVRVSRNNTRHRQEPPTSSGIAKRGTWSWSPGPGATASYS